MDNDLSDLSASDVYRHRTLWTIRLVNILIIVGVTVAALGTDIRNPQISGEGIVAVSFIGCLSGAIVAFELLRYARPDDLEVGAQNLGTFASIVGAAAAGFFMLYVVFALTIGFPVAILSTVYSFPFPADQVGHIASLIAAVLASIVAPEWLLTYRSEIKTQQSNTAPTSESSSKPGGEDSRTNDDNADSVTVPDLVKKFDGLLDSAEESRTRAKKAIRNESYELALDQLKNAKREHEKAADLDESHNLGRSEEIAIKQADLNDLFTRIEQATNEDSEDSSAEGSASDSSEATKKTQNWIDSSKNAIEDGQFKTAQYGIFKARSVIQDEERDDYADTERLKTEVDELERQFRSEVNEEIQQLSSNAEERYERARNWISSGEYDKDRIETQLGSALDSLKSAEELSNRYDLGYEAAFVDRKREIRSYLDITLNQSSGSLYTELRKAKAIAQEVSDRVGDFGNAEEVDSMLKTVKAQRDTTRRAIRSSDYDRAEEALHKLRDDISELEGLDQTETISGKFHTEADKFERKIAAGRASSRVNGFLGAVGSSRSQAKRLLDEGAYDRAKTRLESALDSLDGAEELNKRHSLGREDTIAERKEEIRSLLEVASDRPSEDLSAKLRKAESEASKGIEAHDEGDYTAASEAFEVSLRRYEDAYDLVSQYDLDQQWEIEQRRSMVREYLEVTQETLDQRRRTINDDLDQTLEAAESGLLRAEQYVEVNDFVSARESLTQAQSQIDDAARLLETGLATDRLSERYDETTRREKRLREQLPDEEFEGYRSTDLVEYLQVLATKVGEPPRPELVNQYGEYPADAYLDTFGSWPEALAAANLDPIDETNRERRSYTRVDVLDATVDLTERLGHPPSKGEMNRKGEMSASPGQSRFNDWETALEIAGVAGDSPKNGDTDDEGVEDTEAADAVESEQENDAKSGILGEIQGEIEGFDTD
jgi:hypothetical protein